MRRIVARIGRAHGIRGEVSIEVRTDAPEDRFTTGAVLLLTPPPVRRGQRRSAVSPADPASPGLPAELTVSRVRDHNGTLLLTFEEVGDRSAADALRDHLLEAEVGGDQDAEPDAWYDEELIGLEAVSPTGQVLGVVVALDTGYAQDRLIVRRPDGVRRMVPFVHQLVPEVDIRGGRIVIDAPPGLVDDGPPDGDAEHPAAGPAEDDAQLDASVGGDD